MRFIRLMRVDIHPLEKCEICPIFERMYINLINLINPYKPFPFQRKNNFSNSTAINITEEAASTASNS